MVGTFHRARRTLLVCIAAAGAACGDLDSTAGASPSRGPTAVRGDFSLSVAGAALTVWGIDISEESIACAIENAELNSIGNVAFFAGNVGEVLRDLRERAGEPDVVIVDPPRAGLAGKALRRLGEIGAPRVVYVSCNPTTLAGDLKRLSDDYGYRLVRARPVDMFPHTPHVECVALLERTIEP